MIRDNTKTQGEISELRFYLRAFEHGFIVSKPFGDNARYDFIVDSGNRLSRVQIKSVSVIDTTRRTNKYRINATHGGKEKHKYLPEECDILAAYVIPEDTWYIIPISKITGASVNLYPHRGGSIGNYEGHREGWGIF